MRRFPGCCSVIQVDREGRAAGVCVVHHAEEVVGVPHDPGPDAVPERVGAARGGGEEAGEGGRGEAGEHVVFPDAAGEARRAGGGGGGGGGTHFGLTPALV